MTAGSAHLNAQTPLTPAIQAWEMYLNDQGRSPNTVKAFLSDIRILTEFLPPDRSLGAITTEDLNRYFDWMEKERGVPCSPKTLARRITSTKSFFRWLHQFGVLLIDPGEKVPNRSVLSPLPTVLTDEEMQAALDAANKHRTDKKPDARLFALLSLLLTTAVKKSECLGIHLNHIELDDPEGPYVFIRYASPANRYKERKIPLTDEWIEAYHEYVAQYEPVDQLFPWSPRRLEYLLEDIGEEAGFKKHLSFDMCRWTSVLVDFKNGMEHDRIRQKLGISKIQWREIRMKLRKLSREE
ncbi:MAG: site-specific integrase [Anaerolineae bacterium]|jgi:site-specific recombinase XerD|nr:site-specific integrase [Anaerolineae bacterium]MBT7072437.1 site-specific integrase [Anaerolineae bacterium]MBT7326566.1 site-specific integrase [Anaerolineae bacterium]